MKTRIASIALAATLALAGCGGGGGSPPVKPVPPIEISFAALKDGETVRSGTYTVSGDPVEIAAFYVAWARLEEARMKIESGESLNVGGLSLKCSGSEECGLEIDVDAETVTVTGTIEFSEFKAERSPPSGAGGGSGGSGGSGGGGSGSGSVQSMNPEVNIRTRSLAVNEGGSTELTVMLNRAATEELTLTFSVSGTAARDDFQTISEGGVTVNAEFTEIMVTIPEGEDSITVLVSINDDVTAEGSERLVLTLNPGDGYRRGNRYTLTLTINESDGGGMGSPIAVGTGGIEKNGDLDLGRVKGALSGFSPSLSSVNAVRSLPNDASHWGVWLSGQNELIVWHRAPTAEFGDGLRVSDTQSTGTATYGGSVRGLGHYESSGTEKFGEFTAVIRLTASFDADPNMNTLTGTVSGFRGEGADPAWQSVTLNNGGTVSGGATGGWGYGLYRKADTGEADGATGYVDLNFAAISEANGGGTESAVGAFHAIKR